MQSKDNAPSPERMPVVSGRRHALRGRPRYRPPPPASHRGPRRGMRERRRSVGIDDATAYRSAQPYLALTNGLLPDLVVELAGIADGAGVPFLELFRLNCPGARLPAESPWLRRQQAQRTPGGGCTSMVSRGPDGVVLGPHGGLCPGMAR